MDPRDDIGQCAHCGADISIIGLHDEYAAGLTILCDECSNAWEAATFDDEGRYAPTLREEA